MFDIGFSELVVIGLVALIVIGPERLPRVARTVGHLIGRLQRYVADVKSDISREVELDELRKMRDTVQEAASGFENSITTGLSKTQEELNTSLGMDATAPEATSDAKETVADSPAHVAEAAVGVAETAGLVAEQSEAATTTMPAAPHASEVKS